MSNPCATGRIVGDRDGRGSCRTEIGKIRTRNEDAVLLRDWPGAEGAVLAVVADGMGSYGGGDLASGIVVNEFERLLDTPMPATRLQRCEALLAAFYAADARIRESAAIGNPEMGATAVAAILTAGDVVHLYAGDCRLYHIRGGKIVYRTRDHSAVQVLVDSGKITADQARSHRMRNMVTSCLGGPSSVARMTIDPHLWFDSDPAEPAGSTPYRRLDGGDRIVVCSDGLWGAVADAQLAAMSARTADVHDFVRHCVELALETDGSDNISMIAITADASSVANRTGALVPQRLSERNGRRKTP